MQTIEFLRLFRTPMSEWEPNSELEKFVQHTRLEYDASPYDKKSTVLENALNKIIDEEGSMTAGIATPSTPLLTTPKDDDDDPSRVFERRVFHVDVGDMPPAKANEYLRNIMSEHRNVSRKDIERRINRESRKNERELRKADTLTFLKQAGVKVTGLELGVYRNWEIMFYANSEGKLDLTAFADYDEKDIIETTVKLDRASVKRGLDYIISQDSM